MKEDTEENAPEREQVQKRKSKRRRATEQAQSDRANTCMLERAQSDRPNTCMLHLGISAADKEGADCFLVSARASDARAHVLNVRSSVTGRPDGMGMNIAGGAQKVKQDAAVLGISAADKVEADRSQARNVCGGGRRTQELCGSNDSCSCTGSPWNVQSQQGRPSPQRRRSTTGRAS